MHSYLYGKLPGSFDGLWLANKFFHPDRANLRNANDLYVPKHRLDFSQRFPLHYLPKLWNDFDCAKLKNTPNHNSFRDGLKEYFLNDLDEIVYCGRAFCRDCFPE